VADQMIQHENFLVKQIVMERGWLCDIYKKCDC